MSSINQESIREALKVVKYPGFSRDIVSFGLVREISINGSDVEVQLVISTAENAVAKTIRDEATQALKSLVGSGCAATAGRPVSPASRTSGSIGTSPSNGTSNLAASLAPPPVPKIS